MPDEGLVANHYTHGELLKAVLAGVAKLGKTTSSINIDDLGPLDEFHIGGRLATRAFLDQLNIQTSDHALDIGCGLGGAARFATNTYGCRVTGVDLTREYVETGSELCAWLELNDRVTLKVANATRLPFGDETFDLAYMLHVGMNIAEKEHLAKELYRVVKSRGKIGIYDVMRVGDGDLTFPVPWATEPAGSSVATVQTYRAALESAGFHIAAERNRRDFAIDFFKQLQAKVASADGPPPLGLHILMGNTAPLKVRNMIDKISRNVIAPVEIIAHKAV